MLKREQKKVFYGVIARVLLTIISLITVFVAMVTYWLNFTTMDAVEFLGVYIGFGSMINLLIIVFADSCIEKFIDRETRLINLYSGTKRRVKKLSNVA